MEERLKPLDNEIENELKNYMYLCNDVVGIILVSWTGSVGESGPCR